MALAERPCDGFESESSRARFLLDSEAELQKGRPASIPNKMSQKEKWRASAFALRLHADISLCRALAPQWRTHTHSAAHRGLRGVSLGAVSACSVFLHTSPTICLSSESPRRQHGWERARDRRLGGGTGREERGLELTLFCTSKRIRSFSETFSALDSCG